MDSNKTKAIELTCLLIDRGEATQAENLLQDKYPFVPIIRERRSYTPRKMTRLFKRDGFIDRYRGQKLVHPAALRLISHYLPRSFPFHNHGKMDECHIAFWELLPTIDHIVPIARGGNNSVDNLVCCSMLSNSIKANWLLQELEWELWPPGDLSDWDGMFDWFLNHVKSHPELLSMKYIKNWYYAGIKVSYN